jgi:ABC-type lipoprotein release transport system permease subunit
MLNAIAIATTVAVVTLFVSVITELVSFTNQTVGQGMSRLVVIPKLAMLGSPIDGLPVSFYPMFQKIDGVRVVQRRIAINGRHPSGATYLVFGEEEKSIELYPDFYPVSPAEFEAWKKERPMGAILTDTTAQDLLLKVGDTTEVPTAFGPLRIKVVAITHGAVFLQSIAIHFEYMQEFTKNTDTCGYRVFTAPEDLDRVTAAIAELTKNSVMPAQAVEAAQFRAANAKQAAMIPAILGFLGLFLILTTGLTLANSSAIAIRQRRTEAATLRVIGYRRGAVVRLFVSEGVLVGMAGGLLAILFMSVVFRNGVQLSSGGMLAAGGLFSAVKIGWFAILCGALTSIVVPLVGTYFPAVIAMRRPLVEGLRDTA